MWPAEQPALSNHGIPLKLRPLRSSDLDAVTKACQDPHIQHFTMVPTPYSRTDADAFLDAATTGWTAQNAAIFAITDNDDAFIGACSLLAVDLERSRAGIGYWVAPWGRGQGAARDAVRLVTTWAHNVIGIRQLLMEIEPANPASVRSAEAAGFTFNGQEATAKVKGDERLFHIYEHNAQKA